MNVSKALLIGMLTIASTLALAQSRQNVPAAEDVMTPGARLVVGESPDVDFTILKPGEEEAKTKTATTLPHKNTPGVTPPINTLAIDKVHKHLFVQEVKPTIVATPAKPAEKPTPTPAKPSAQKKTPTKQVAFVYHPTHTAAYKKPNRPFFVSNQKPMKRNSFANKKPKTPVKVSATQPHPKRKVALEKKPLTIGMAARQIDELIERIERE